MPILAQVQAHSEKNSEQNQSIQQNLQLQKLKQQLEQVNEQLSAKQSIQAAKGLDDLGHQLADIVGLQINYFMTCANLQRKTNNPHFAKKHAQMALNLAEQFEQPDTAEQARLLLEGLNLNKALKPEGLRGLPRQAVDDFDLDSRPRKIPKLRRMVNSQ